ncbi:hypothetical protein CR205_13185 [Alteribacter lacisalsi]|uniref:Staygreen protein domain-containing protein n=1 Tax=Alteribacter lacisalsi TaxID=2045244 RepID=A0A2W0HSS2_9BACI|nr:hypothetical protein CR205_13185 [Alteribacter lacisalsi]
MGRLDPGKLSVEFRPGVTAVSPILGRKYTLTHSDVTAELFLTVGLVFDYDKVTSMRDEVLAEWSRSGTGLILSVCLYVGNFGPHVNAVRNAVFRRELPLALEAIVYGDNQFFAVHPQLNHAAIWISFVSEDPVYSRCEYWGTPLNYK